MPDVAMCAATPLQCAKARVCYRNQLSGTKPTPEWQSYMDYVSTMEEWMSWCYAFSPTPAEEKRMVTQERRRKVRVLKSEGGEDAAQEG